MDQALGSLLNNGYFKLHTEQLHTYIKIIEYLIDLFAKFALPCLDDLIELREYLMNDVQEYLSAPILLIFQHVLYDFVGLLYQAVLVQLLKGELLRLEDRLQDVDSVTVQTSVVHYVVIRDVTH